MERAPKIYAICCLIILLIGVYSCSNSSDSGTRVLQTGTTSAGRDFSVIEEKEANQITLLIDGEDAITLAPTNLGVLVLPGTVQVFEYASTTNLVHIDWKGDVSNSRNDRNQRNYYQVFQAGQAKTTLIKGNNMLEFYSGLTDETGSGSYHMAYENDTLTIIENEERFDKTDVCYAEEKLLTREFNIASALVQLTYCEEEYRTATLAFDTGCEGLDEALHSAPWAIADLSADIRAQKCAAIR